MDGETNLPNKRARKPLNRERLQAAGPFGATIKPGSAARANVDQASLDDDKNAIRLSFLIHDVSRMRRSAYDQFMKPLAITRAQWWVLANLSRQDGMMQTQLAAVLDVGKASLGILIEKLERSGWLTRQEDPNDKRAKRVFLTRPAHALIARMTKMEHSFNKQVLADLTPEERATLVTALQKIKDSIGRMDFHAAMQAF